MTYARRAHHLIAFFLFTLLTATLAGAAGGAQGSENGGTVRDSRTGLIWVADPAYVMTTGFADRVVLPRAEALRFIAAMNAGEIENFGYTTWRLPSEAELRHFLKYLRFFRKDLLQPATAAADGVFVWPVKAGSAPPGFSDVSVFATNSIWIENKATIHSGGVIVNAPSGPPYLTSDQLTIGPHGNTASGFDVKSDTLRIKAKSVVACDDPDHDGVCNNVFCNELTENGGQHGVTCTPLGSDPVFDFLPAFIAQAPRPEAADVVVPIGGSTTLAPGDYRDILVGKNGAVTFTGGVYNVRSISAGIGTRLLFAAASEVRVEGKLNTEQNSTVGPAPASGITAADVLFYVAGINGTSGALDDTPKAAQLGTSNVVNANVYAPNGTLYIRQNAVATGAFLGRDVIVSVGAEVSLASAFVNQPPTADPQFVFTHGAGAIVITLTGSDPENDSLSFSIVTPPSHGTLSALTPIVPPPVTDPDTGETAQPPTVSATVTYTPDSGDDLEDSFTFQVADGNGGVGVATVTINPPPEVPPPPPPPVATVVAVDRSAVTSKENPVTLTLRGEAPCDESGCDGVGDDVPLTFSITGGPAHGSLSDLTQGSGTPQRTATVTYTPEEGFVSPPVDSFTFAACGEIDAVEVCDEATVTVEVFEAQATATDQQVTTPANTPVTITLDGSPGFPGSEKSLLPAKAVFSQPAAVAGNVASSAFPFFLGDNHNDLPGPSPVLMAAAVDATGGAGSNGTVRMHVEWDLHTLAPLAGQITGAEVVLQTVKGSVDSLDTSFFSGNLFTPPDGLLTDADYQTSVTPLPDAVMPVPDVPTGTEGTYSFDVTSLVQDALAQSLDGIVIQGRVNESLAGSGFARGLQVRTTADGNRPGRREPQLSITTSGAVMPLTFSIATLPSHGTLRGEFGTAIADVPTLLVSRRLIYAPDSDFNGNDVFYFQVDNGLTTALGRVAIIIGTGQTGDCQTDPAGCDDGR